MAPLSALLLATSCALASANTVRWDITKNTHVEARHIAQRALRTRNIEARANTVTATLSNDVTDGLYAANVTVGTPGQNLQLQIDTGSSDVWVPSSSASICEDIKDGGCPDGSFDSSKSSTFNVVEENGFNISYVDGTGSTGDYFEDVFSIGGATLHGFQMGLATNSSIATGIMGIGYNSSEANVDTGNSTVYANLPQALQNAGLINANAYSLWLNDLQATSGSVLFGGIDTEKYHGDLISVDVYPSQYPGEPAIYSSFTVAFTSLTASSDSGTDVLTPSNYAAAAILDSGTTITLLPNDIVETVYEELGATMDQELDTVVVPCSLANKNGTLSYGFGGPGGPVISVAVSQLVIPFPVTTGPAPTFKNGETACQLGIEAAGEDPVLFGDTFLRSAYVVYDLDNNRVALAQTDFNSTKSNIVAFESGGAAIPSASTAANGAAVTQTASGDQEGVTSVATATGSGIASFNPTATGLNAAAGFTSTSSASASASSGKKSDAPGLKPFQWSALVVGGITAVGMALSGGLFALF